MQRRRWLTSLLATLGLPAWVRAQTAPAAPGKKVLRYAFEIAETTIDPAKVTDIYSRTLTPHIFEAPYRYDHLARPIKVRPLTADGMPQVSADFRTWTVKIRPGIHFADDPAFKGKRRELVAQDYVYSFKRFADPANQSEAWTYVADFGMLGLVEQHDETVAKHVPFDYDRELAGVCALDRYTLRFRFKEPRPRFGDALCGSDLHGAVAREVIEYYGAQGDAHPVGTGPFRLAQWRRSSFIAFERNPDFREMLYDAEPAADDAEGQAILARLKGRRLPLVDRVEISIIDEAQPRWLSFVSGEADLIDKVSSQFITIAMPGGKVAPNLAKRGVRAYQVAEPGASFVLFNMEDGTVGGYTPDKVALRRAIGLGIDTPSEIRLLRNGQGVPAQTPLLPFTSGYDPHARSEFGTYDPARAKGLLDLYGYLDRDGDGWRELPDGKPLVLQMLGQADQRSRAYDELLRKNMEALGLRMEFRISQWPENLKLARAGKLMMWNLGVSAAGPDGEDLLEKYNSHEIGGQNYARFNLPAFDAVLDRLKVIPDGPEREALYRQACALALAYMPYKWGVNRILTDMSYPWVIGFRRPVFWQEWWHWVDIDTTLLPKA